MNDPNYNRNNNNDFSGGEMFVAVNLLSKIGVVFLIASVIAFTAASGGYIPDVLRMVLVVLAGVIMFIAGEIFYRKKSRVFANALIYGGIVELFLAASIGSSVIYVFQSMGTLIMSAIVALAGLLLAIRYKSQGMVIVTEVAVLVPVVAIRSPSDFFFLTVCFMTVNCVAAAVSRKNFYTAAMFTGIVLSWLQMLIIWIAGMIIIGKGSGLTSAVFALCCGMSWSCGALLNSCEKDGETEGVDICAFLMSQGAAVLFSALILRVCSNVRAAGAALMALAMIYSIIAVCFGLKYHPRCRVVSMLINIALAAAELSVFMLIRGLTPLYIVLHATAAAVFCIGIFLKRELFRNWGFALLSIAEMSFFTAMARADDLGRTGEKLLVIGVNLALWFGLMAVMSMKEKRNGAAFRGYTCAVFVNMGVLLCNLVSEDLRRVISDSIEFDSSHHRFAFIALMCALVWIICGFTLGRLRYMDKWRAPCSSMLYGIGLICLLCGNTAMSRGRFLYDFAGGLCIPAAIVVNIVSVLAVLDAVLLIAKGAPKFQKAAGLIVSGYALMSLTALLSINDFINFSSCVISIIYISMAAVWIIVGFKKRNALLRRFGLALALFASAKLFLFDFRSVNSMGRTLLFIGFGMTLLTISFAYAAAEKHISNRKK